MSSILTKLRNKVLWLKDDFLWLSRKRVMPTANQLNYIGTVSIGVATFKDRFENQLKPLIRRLCYLFPECRIIVVANGHVQKREQSKYISRISSFCKNYRNVYLTTFTDPVGLSYIWNLIIAESGSDHILILNDDLSVKTEFREFIFKSGIIGEKVATINSSWSHFLISRDVINRAGLFDEGLKEIGGEDDDYLARLAILDIPVHNYITDTLRRKTSRRAGRVNSYGRDMTREVGGYSTLNTEYLMNKWEASNDYFEGAKMVEGRGFRYWKLRQKQG